MADGTSLSRQDIIRGWSRALDVVRRTGCQTITLPVVDLAIILDAASNGGHR